LKYAGAKRVKERTGPEESNKGLGNIGAKRGRAKELRATESVRDR